MGRSSEAWQDQQDIDNESGIDDYLSWVHSIESDAQYVEDQKVRLAIRESRQQQIERINNWVENNPF